MMEILQQLSSDCLKNIVILSLIKNQMNLALNLYIINVYFLSQQSKILQKLFKSKVNVPRLYKVDLEHYKIQMQYIPGKKLKSYINELNINIVEDLTKIHKILQKIGQLVRRIHQIGVIHGDLTTSNMIYNEDEIYLIDFGLSYIKNSIEDRAVDLYVLERAFISTHPHLQKQFEKMLIVYNQESVLKRLQVVRQRGRKKIVFG